MLDSIRGSGERFKWGVINNPALGGRGAGGRLSDVGIPRSLAECNELVDQQGL